MTASTSLPFYPVCSTDRVNDVTVWWFEKDFCQIGYGPNPERGRNACVLICLLTAAKIGQKSVPMVLASGATSSPSTGLVTALAEGILEGIETYAKLADDKKLPATNLTIPEAYQALGKKVVHIHEWVRNPYQC